MCYKLEMEKTILEKINPLHLSELHEPAHPSSFIQEDEYDILIVRGLSVSEEGLGFVSKGIVIDEQKRVFHFDEGVFKAFEFPPGMANLYSLVAPVYQRNGSIIKQYVEEIDKLEDSLFERKASRIFMDIWFDLKKDLSRIERHLERGLAVLGEFYKSRWEDKSFQEAEFKNLMDGVRQNKSSAGNQISRLDALYNYHVSIKNDRLNKNIFLLTLLSAVFLPLNLIVGFFGMNTENLFFQGNAQGTRFVLFIILGSLAASVFGLPLARFIDHHILKIFLGRYDLYKKISGKLDKIFKID